MRRRPKPHDPAENGSFPFVKPALPPPAAAPAPSPADPVAVPPKRAPPELSEVLQNLRLHEIELQMQNEELRRAQLELDTLRARYFDLYDLAPIGYCTLSKPGVIIQANLTAANLLGLSRSAGIGRAFVRFVDAQDQGVLHGLLQRAAVSGGPQSAELRMIGFDGTRFWAHLVVSAGQDAAGEAEWRLVLSDVSARRQAETARRDVEARYRELFCRANDGIVVCSAEGLIEEANQAFARVHGWPEAEKLAGMNLRDLDPGGVALAAERMGQMFLGHSSTFQVEHRHRDGQAIELEGSTSLIFAAGVPKVLAYYRLKRAPSAPLSA